MILALLLALGTDPQPCPPCICVCNSQGTQVFEGYALQRTFANGALTEWHVPSAFVSCLKVSGPGMPTEPMCGWRFDWDYDGDLDLHDWSLVENRAMQLEVVQPPEGYHVSASQEPTRVFIAAMWGPGRNVWPEMLGQDRDHDGDVDLRDWALLANSRR